MNELIAWGNFYLVVGSAAGALIGLQFVVLTLIASRPSTQGAEANAAFSTPTIVHFGNSLLMSAMMLVPWPNLTCFNSVFVVISFFGIIYTSIVARRMKKQKAYQPIIHDWFFHFILPLIVYLSVALISFIIYSCTNISLLIIGMSVMTLLFIGIHNAWDAVTYHVFNKNK
jgi:hypothetical protein